MTERTERTERRGDECRHILPECAHTFGIIETKISALSAQFNRLRTGLWVVFGALLAAALSVVVRNIHLYWNNINAVADVVNGG